MVPKLFQEAVERTDEEDHQGHQDVQQQHHTRKAILYIPPSPGNYPPLTLFLRLFYLEINGLRCGQIPL